MTFVNAGLLLLVFTAFVWLSLSSMRPAQAIGLGFLALAALAVWVLVAVEITTGQVYGGMR